VLAKTADEDMSPRVEFGHQHRVPEINVRTVRFDRMRRAHGQLLLLGIFVFIDIAASAPLVRRLQDCLFVDLAGGRDCPANLDAVLKPPSRLRFTASLRRPRDIRSHNKSVIAAAIHPLQQFDDLSLQGGLSCRIQCRKCAVGRAVICLEDFEPMAR